MNAAQNIALYLIQTIAGIYVFIAIMRVLLQAARADYYNPVSQFIVKATQAPVSILGKAIPSWKRIDLAAILWVLIVQVIATEIAALSVGGFVPVAAAITWAVIASVHLLLTIIFWAMVVLIVISFAMLLGGGIIQHPVLDLIRQLMAPIMYPVQKIMPPMGGIDLSPLIIFMLINVLQIITTELAINSSLDPRFVVGF